MKSRTILLALFALVACFSLSDAAFAARAYGSTVVWLGSDNLPIGQQIVTCNSVAQHGGNINASNPYYIRVQTACNDSEGISCSTNSNGTTTCTHVGSDLVAVGSYKLAGGASLETVCGRLDGLCELQGPIYMYGYGFDFTSGYQ